MRLITFDFKMEEFSAHVGIRMEENSVQDTTRFAGSKSNKLHQVPALNLFF